MASICAIIKAWLISHPAKPQATQSSIAANDPDTLHHLVRGGAMKKSLVVLICAATVITACGGAPAASPTPDVNALATQVAGNIFATQTAAAPQATATSQPTATARPTEAPQVADTPVPTPKGAVVPGAVSFSDITFAAGVLNDEVPVDARTSFPEGVTLIYALFNGKGLQEGDAWRSEWLLDGEVQPKLSTDHTWDAKSAGARGAWWLSVFNDQGIHAGEWQLNLYAGDQLVQSGKFTVEPYAAGEPSFGPIVFAQDVTKDDKPVQPVEVSDPTLPAGTTTVYAFFNGIGVPSNTEWTSQWFFNDSPATDPKSHTWNFGPNEQDWINFKNTDDSPLDAGVYELKLTIGPKVVNQGTFIIPAK
jgi:hypothetical protein